MRPTKTLHLFFLFLVWATSVVGRPAIDKPNIVMTMAAEGSEAAEAAHKKLQVVINAIPDEKS